MNNARMVIVDKAGNVSFQKPYAPTSKSNSLVITIPMAFRDVLGIDTNSQLELSIDKKKKVISIKKVDNDSNG